MSEKYLNVLIVLAMMLSIAASVHTLFPATLTGDQDISLSIDVGSNHISDISSSLMLDQASYDNTVEPVPVPDITMAGLTMDQTDAETGLTTIWAVSVLDYWVEWYVDSDLIHVGNEYDADYTAMYVMGIRDPPGDVHSYSLSDLRDDEVGPDLSGYVGDYLHCQLRANIVAYFLSGGSGNDTVTWDGALIGQYTVDLITPEPPEDPPEEDPGTVTGWILEAEGGHSPVDGATVTIGSYNGVTDAQGYYSITEIVPGDYNIHVTKVGYLTYSDVITIIPGSSRSKTIYIASAVWIPHDDDNGEDGGGYGETEGGQEGEGIDWLPIGILISCSVLASVILILGPKGSPGKSIAALVVMAIGLVVFLVIQLGLVVPG